MSKFWVWSNRYLNFDCLDLGHCITVWRYQDFLSLIFYVKSFLEILEVRKIVVFQFQGPWIFIKLVNFSLQKEHNSMKIKIHSQISLSLILHFKNPQNWFHVKSDSEWWKIYGISALCVFNNKLILTYRLAVVVQVVVAVETKPEIAEDWYWWRRWQLLDFDRFAEK